MLCSGILTKKIIVSAFVSPIEVKTFHLKGLDSLPCTDRWPPKAPILSWLFCEIIHPFKSGQLCSGMLAGNDTYKIRQY